jgi:folate-binding protein YgfZ
MFKLPYRSVIKISGNESEIFLQRLISNDISDARMDSLLYALILEPKGRILYDLFILQIKENEYLIDIPKPYKEKLLNSLNLYKLGSDVSINSLENYNVVISKSFNRSLFKDPRSEQLDFYRGFEELEADYSIQELNEYHLNRIQLKIAELCIDFPIGERLPIELGMEKLNAISLKKGCYIGQEVTTRSIRQGKSRNGIYHLRFMDSEIGEIDSKSAKIIAAGDEIGFLMNNIKGESLAILDNKKIEEIVANNLTLMFNHSIINVVN